MAINPRQENAFSFKCPKCGTRAINRRTIIMSPNTRTKNYQCINIDCGMIFETTEEITNIRIDSALSQPKKMTFSTTKNNTRIDICVTKQLNLL